MRRVGLSQSLLEALEALRSSRKRKAGYVILSKEGRKVERYGLASRLRRLGKGANVAVSPHALRRAFVTINANKGRPLNMLQRACGHSDIKTTMSYCLTSEQEVIDAMKDW